MTRRTERTRPPATPRRAIEGLLSLLALAVAFEWAQGAEPEPWYANPAVGDGELRAAGQALQPGPWHVPVITREADPVAHCSATVTEWWSAASAPSVGRRPAGDAVCVLPLPGRWVGDATRPGSPTREPLLLPAGDALAVRPEPVRSPSGGTPVESASDSGWSGGGRRVKDAIASAGERW